MVYGTEDNNAPKIEVRKNLSCIINDYFGDRPLSWIEMLGAGEGAKTYVDMCNIRRMLLVEYSNKKYKQWMNSGRFGELQMNAAMRHGGVVIPICQDINQFFKHGNFGSWDIVNLDFCSYYYPKGKTVASTGEIIETAFEQQVITNGGLMINTFMVKGHQIDASKIKSSIITEKDSIVRAIQEQARRHKYEVELVPFGNGVYNSTKRTQMLYLTFRCIKCQ